MGRCIDKKTYTHKGVLLWGPSLPLHQIFDFTLGRERNRHSETHTHPVTTHRTVRPIPLCKHTVQGPPPTSPPMQRPPHFGCMTIPDCSPYYSTGVHLAANIAGSPVAEAQSSCHTGETETTWRPIPPKIQCPEAQC